MNLSSFRQHSQFILVFCISLALGCSIESHFLIDQNWDRAMYHDYVSDALTHGWLKSDWMAAGLNTWTNPLSEQFIKFFEWVFQPTIGDKIFGLTVLTGTTTLLWLLCMEIFRSNPKRKNISMFVTLFGLMSPFFLSELGTTFQNSYTTLPIITGVLFWAKYVRQPKEIYLFCCFIFLGLAVTCKLTNIIFLLPFLVLFTFTLFSQKGLLSTTRSLSSTICGLSVGLSPLIVWSYFTYVNTGNPFFPYYNKLFHSNYFPNTNFRDMRWKFQGFTSLKSIYSGWLYGNPISELKAIDVGIALVFLTYSIVGILSLRTLSTRERFRQKLPEFYSNFSITNFIEIWYFFSFTLWVLFFFYARYAEPLELMSGLILYFSVQRISNFYPLISRNLPILLLVCLLVNFCVLRVPNWTNASATPSQVQADDRWTSPLTKQIGQTTGIFLVSGDPVSFIRLSDKSISSIIRIDYGKIPGKYVKLLASSLKIGQPVHFLYAGQKINTASLQEKMQSVLHDSRISLSGCESPIGPIQVDYLYCEVRS